MDYLIVALLLISIGSMRFYWVQNDEAPIEYSMIGKLLLQLLPVISFIFLTILISNIGDLKWYWSLIISILAVLVLSNIFANIYSSSILGVKTKPQISLRAGGIVRYHVHIINAIITFALGLILFFIYL